MCVCVCVCAGERLYLRTIGKRMHKDVNAAKIILHSLSYFLSNEGMQELGLG